MTFASQASDLDAPEATRTARLAIVVAALGYLVDIYDLILFSVVRTPSLQAIGVPLAHIADTGLFLLDVQMIGMLIGGFAWGILGDKRGRLSVLFGSILTYSLANLANGFVTTVDQYTALRFIAGVGLAGELGAGVTLVMELLPASKRGAATAWVAGIGACGALLAFAVASLAPWYVAYWIGGALGLLLLLLRVGIFESGLYHRAETEGVSRGDFRRLFADRVRARRYVSVVLVAVPVWFSIGILVSFCTEIARAMGMEADQLPQAKNALACAYAGLAVGDVFAGLLSQKLRSRKRALYVFCTSNLVGLLYYFTVAETSEAAFYAGCFLLGLTNGYWAVFVTVASEQFGTNLRATATTTAPNLVRGSLVAVSLMYVALRDRLFGGAGVGEPMAALVVGIVVIAISIVAVRGLEETYGKDLDFLE